MTESSLQSVDALRRFNRFYTRQIGVLDETLLSSGFSLIEARILYELSQNRTVTASDLVRDLAIDPGYVSRLLTKLKKAGLIEKITAEHDRRQSLLSLTGAGRKVFGRLEQRSRQEASDLLSALNPVDRNRLATAMSQIEDILSPQKNGGAPFVLRDHRPGDMGWVTHRHAVLYAEEFGWDGRFEALVADITAKFVDHFDPAKERCWIAERSGEIIGSIFLVKESDDIAKLRLLYVEPKARGLGLGKALVAESLAFARRSAYRKVTLWTNDILHAARHIYEEEGFRLIKEEAHHSFGKDLVGQYWELDLTS